MLPYQIVFINLTISYIGYWNIGNSHEMHIGAPLVCKNKGEKVYFKTYSSFQ